MKKAKKKAGGGIFRKIKSKLSREDSERMSVVPLTDDTSANENLQIIEEYNTIKQHAEDITGWDFDRAFAFLEKYPDSDHAIKLKKEMHSTNSNTLKGLSYESAARVLTIMPDHPGVPSIINGMKKLEKEFIRELKSDVIAKILEVVPDHPYKETLAKSLADKNLTNAYDFIECHPEHPCSRLVIQAMFDCDPNIATLLLHERMDHPQVDAIFKGIYSISEKGVVKLMPDAILFIIDVASDHQYTDLLLETLVEKNYIKAFDFAQTNPDHQLVEELKGYIGKRKPELLTLLGQKK